MPTGHRDPTHPIRGSLSVSAASSGEPVRRLSGPAVPPQRTLGRIVPELGPKRRQPHPKPDAHRDENLSETHLKAPYGETVQR